MDLSIIIVNYNTIELTKACIESIHTHTKGIVYEIIVVDNDSRDGSIDYFSSLPEITFIESGENIGFGRANNLGSKYSSGRYLLMLNSDTIVENNILNRMVHRFDEQPEDVACLGSLLINAEGQPCQSHGFFVRWRDEFYKHKPYGDVTSIGGKQQDVEYIIGADLFVRRSVAKKYGLFDPDFFMYYEDNEMGFRYHRYGLRSVIVNERGIVHLEGASSTNAYRKICIITRSYFLYLRKTLSKQEFYMAKLCILMRRIFTVWHYRWSFKNSLNYIKLIFMA